MLKSSGDLNKSSFRGLYKEAIVAQEYFKQGSVFLAHRLKIFCAEIDLVFMSKSGTLTLIEVKTRGEKDYLEFRLTRSQKNRLKNAHLFLQEKFKEPVEFHFALVDDLDRLEVLKDGILT